MYQLTSDIIGQYYFLPKSNSLGGVYRLQSEFSSPTTKRDDINSLSEGDLKSWNRLLVLLLVKAIKVPDTKIKTRLSSSRAERQAVAL